MKFRGRLWLRIKFYWYKYIRRLDVIGFFGGVPIVRSRHIVEESKKVKNTFRI